MNAGSIFFDTKFHFHDGQDGEKLFVALGAKDGVIVVAKTTSRQHTKGTTFGCQPLDRFHNFYLPKGCCYLKKCTWICLDEFYELKYNEVLQKKYQGTIKPVCDLPQTMIRSLQDCALESLDISSFQEAIITSCLV